MRSVHLGGLLLFLASMDGCAHTNHPLPDIPCDPKCTKGQTCDVAIGECRADPCEGRCTKWERCVGPDYEAHCELIPTPEMQYNRPDTSAPSSMY